MKGKLLFVALLLCVLPVLANAQCAFENTAFKGGEDLVCNFYFNWKFVWIKAGGARLVVKDTMYQSQKAMKMSLLSSTNKRADAFFRMRDTLETVFTPELVPLYYKKSSFEGKRYTLNEVYYSYQDDKTILFQRYYKKTPDKTSVEERHDTLSYCVYDMMSLLARARSFDFASLKVGQELVFPVASGYGVENQKLIFRGRKTVKSDDDDDRKYSCLVISLVANKKGKERELITFYVTDDKNHLPILLDLNLNFGSAKALLSKSKGVRYPVKAR